ncbi:MAG: branched-chain-amino-acid transaminase [Candidatus Omnitrophica bacterium]|nr:branched-chain-amino-acid transaminase [Candidatus Omnitrophota bacterium]
MRNNNRLKVYLNGKLVDKSEAKVSVFDHGLLYGDGVFEGIRSYEGLVFKLKEHLDRFFESAKTLMLKIPLSREELTEAIVLTLKTNRLKDAYIRLVTTRGEGDLGLDPRKCDRPTIIIITDRIVLYPRKLYREGLEIITVPTQRNIPAAVDPQIKSLNYLNNILAKIEAVNAGKEEAIMLNHAGYVAECTGDNIFIAKGGELLTPPTYVGALRGITRMAVIAIARREKIPIREEVITRHNVFNAEESFLTGTAAEVIPVVKVDGRMIGKGKPGPLTLRIMREFHKLTRTDGVRYRL